MRTLKTERIRNARNQPDKNKAKVSFMSKDLIESFDLLIQINFDEK